MKALMCSDGFTIYQDKKGNVIIEVPRIVLTHNELDSKQELHSRIERALYELSNDAYGWHSEWEYTSIEGEGDEQICQEERED